MQLAICPPRDPPLTEALFAENDRRAQKAREIPVLSDERYRYQRFALARAHWFPEDLMGCNGR